MVVAESSGGEPEPVIEQLELGETHKDHRLQPLLLAGPSKTKPNELPRGCCRGSKEGAERSVMSILTLELKASPLMTCKWKK